MDDSAVFCGLVCPFDDEAFIILAAAASPAFTDALVLFPAPEPLTTAVQL